MPRVPILSQAPAMARSSGARPKKAVRAKVVALRERLSTIPSHKWITAQSIMDEITDLCGVSGPSGGKMVPRACRTCGFFGHTTQHCEVRHALDAQMTERELERERARGWISPQSLEECPHGPAQWAWICKLEAIKACVAEGERRGLGKIGPHCKRKRVWRSRHDVVLTCDCADCEAWSAWVRSCSIA